jgi:hypothetical protein
MHIKKLILFCALTFSMSAHADLLLTNNTDSYGTGNVASSPCSSQAGDRGITKPHSTLTIPQIAFDLFCGLFTCEARLFATQNCSGPVIATVTIEFNKGVTHINNLSKQFVVSGGGNHITINPGSKTIWQRLFGWV